MKKVFYTIISITILTACKKESSNPTSKNNNNTTDTSKAVVYEGKYGNGITDVEGNKYKTVIIGTQEWMAENLKTSKYNDGTNIPNVTDGKQWTELNTGAWCHYNNSDSLGEIYGKLYNWYATNPTTNKNICPSGWHVPSDSEWKILIDYLGGKTIAGSKMKEFGTIHWKTPNTGSNNSSLFSALPGGSRDEYDFNDLGDAGRWFTSEKPSVLNYSGANYFALTRTIDIAEIGGTNSKFGMSIRCIKD